MTEKTIEEINERHKREIKEFRDKCSHPKVRWLPYAWAMGRRIEE